MISTSKNRFRARALAQAAAAPPALALISTAHAQTLTFVSSGTLNQSITPDGSSGELSILLDFNLNSVNDPSEARLIGLYSSKEDATTFVLSSSGSLRFTNDPQALGTRLVGDFAGQTDVIIGGSGSYYGMTLTPESSRRGGWVQVSISPDGRTATLNQWVYDTSASHAIPDIIVGDGLSAVPEPATYGVMCGVALAGWAVVRRRRGSRSVA